MQRIMPHWATIVVLIGGMCIAPSTVAQHAVDHGLWDQLLKRHVKQGRVGYEGVRADESVLERYLAMLKTTDAAKLPSQDTQLAFWINTYNACVVKGVLDHYPLRSVKDVNGFFDRIRYRVAGQDLSLDEIEHQGRGLGDSRIHFALVCASVSCPPLRPEAYVPERLDAQLDEQARLFLRDPTKGARLENQTLWLSQIFTWFKGDFVRSKLPAFLIPDEKLLPAIEPYLDPQLVTAIRSKWRVIKFLEYDWSLNTIR